MQQRPAVCVVHLHGDLGAGKTTFVRGLLRGFDYTGRVPSPTYTLVEIYELQGYRLAHLDLYRLQDGAELEFLGLDEWMTPPAILLIEWPERASEHLPAPNLELTLAVAGQGRRLELRAADAVGRALHEAFTGS